jgi:sigma-E factor negative regulatory protein RseA
MKPEISALLDDELSSDQASRVLDALRRDRALCEAWGAYHLVGDVLRRTPVLSRNFSQVVMARLAQEPTVLAPTSPRTEGRSGSRFALPLAAALMGVAAVGWVALSLNVPQPTSIASAAKPAPEAPSPAATGLPPGALKEYLVAHQAYSPSSRIQGVAPSIRTVSEIRQGGRK